jgi:hypothetical protein
VQKRQIVESVGDTARRGTRIPARRRRVILTHLLAGRVHHAELQIGLGAAAARRVQGHFARFGDVLRNAQAAELQRIQVIERIGEALTGCAIEPVCGGLEFLWQPGAERVRTSQLICRGEHIAIRGASDPPDRFGGITRHALSAQIELPEHELRFAVSQVGRLATQARRLLKIGSGAGSEQMRQRQQRPDVSARRGTAQPGFRLGRIGLHAVAAHEEFTQVIHRRGLTGFGGLR